MNKKITEEHQKILNHIGYLIREYRLSEGWSQKIFSEYSNLSRQSISRVENGKNISLLTLIEIVITLDIKLSDLFELV